MEQVNLIEMLRRREIEFSYAQRLAGTTQPKPFVTQIPLVDVFERLKRLKADAWQRDFCNKLQEATEKRHIKGTRAIIHAQPQLGKSIILAQIFAVWLFAHEPLHRFALATYNIKRSQRHAKVVIRIMQSPEYKNLFPSTDSHLPDIVGLDNILTNARLALNDGQVSFNPMGLQSGFVGSGADTLAADDPYKNADEARSEIIRENIESFVDDVADVRLTEYANWFNMFHRYHQMDLAGYMLAKAEFDYWRYASEADGDYIDDETGLVYPDPLSRPIGEYISTRFSKDFYERQKRNPKTWFSQFQGKPTGEEGNTFNVKKIHFLDPVMDVEKIEALRAECVHWGRAWDNAATKKETSAFTVGARMGITLDERVLFDHMVRERLNTAERYDKQLETAEDDGFLVPVLIPNDPGSAGTDTAFQTQQMLEKEGYTCYADVVTGSKELRAQPLSLCANSGKMYVALPEDEAKEVRKEYKNFPLSTWKDITDASGDIYRFLYKLLKSGTVIKNYKQTRNDVALERFAQRFGSVIPPHWNLYIGVRISEDASKPSGAVMVARAAENSGLKDTLFITSEFKQYSGDYYKIFDWIKQTLALRKPVQPPRIYLRTDSETIATTARVKLDLPVTLFKEDSSSGVPELNWFYLPRNEASPFNEGEKSAGIYYLKNKESDLLSARQESVLWKFNDKGEPQEYGGIIMDCVRMITFGFRTLATELTESEIIEEEIKKQSPSLTMDNLKKNSPHKLGFTPAQEMARAEAEADVRKKMNLPKEDVPSWLDDWNEGEGDPYEKAGGW